MNKKLVALLVLCLTALTAFGCSSSNTGTNTGSDDPPVVEHEHVYVWIDETPATCVNPGLAAHYGCSGEDCDAVFDADKNDVDVGDLITPTIDHEYYFVKNDDGMHSKKCDGCGFNQSSVHAYTREIEKDEYKKSDADCYNAAVYYKSCECGDFLSDDTAETFTVGEALGHDFNDDKVCTRCELDLGAVSAKIAELPEVSALTLSSIGKIKEAYASWNLLSDVDKTLIEGGSRVETLYEAVKDIEVLNAKSWTSDNRYNTVDGKEVVVLSFKAGTDDVIGDYAEVENHTSGWACIQLDEDTTPSGYVVFYAYNPLDADAVFAYGYLNETKEDSILPGKTPYNVTLKSKTWTRVSFKYDMDYPVMHMRLCKGSVAGDRTTLNGLKLSSWFLVKDVKTITDIVCDKSIEYGDLIPELASDCTNTGVAAHYVVVDKLYNAYKEQVTQADLVIPAKGHSYGSDGKCTVCGDEMVSKMNAAISELPEVNGLKLAHVTTVKELYAQYSSLSDSVKALITDSEKLTNLYNEVKAITVYSADALSDGRLNKNKDTYTFALDNDDTIGSYAEVTQTGTDWPNLSYNIAAKPTARYIVFYVYNPLDSDVIFTFGNQNEQSIYEEAKSLHYTLKSKEWSRVTVEWVYSYNIFDARFTLGKQAGADRTAFTGFKFSAVYEVNNVDSVTDLVYDKSVIYTYVEKVDATCESTGTAAHYKGDNDKLYNLHKEEVTQEDLVIPAKGHSYGADGSCVNAGCTAKLEIVADIAALPDTITPASILKVQELYAQYSALGEEAKAAVSNADKLETLYAAVCATGVTVYDSDVKWGKQCSTDNVTVAEGYDETYGKCYEITHVSGWANFTANVAVNPQNGLIALFIYNPNDAEVKLTLGTTTTIYGNHADAVHYTLSANGWTQIIVDTSFAYELGSGIFVTGEAAGDYTSITGFKVSNAFVADTAEKLTALDPNA